MLGKPLRRKLVDYKSWQKAVKNDSNAPQTWRRNRDRANVAITDLGILATALEEEKQQEVFSSERLAEFTKAVLGYEILPPKPVKSNKAYDKLNKFTESSGWRQLERDVTAMVNLEAEKRRSETGEELLTEDFEMLKEQVLQKNITSDGKALYQKYESLQNGMIKANKNERKDLEKPDLRRVQIASTLALISLEYCREQMPKLFDPVLAELSMTSFGPTRRLLSHMRDKASGSPVELPASAYGGET
jgi:hypothetical protein